jgi:hypothetical protein
LAALRSRAFAQRRPNACRFAADVYIQDNRSNIRNTAGGEFGISLDGCVINTAGKLDHTVVYLDADGALDIPVTIQLSKNFLLNLPIVFH